MVGGQNPLVCAISLNHHAVRGIENAIACGLLLHKSDRFSVGQSDRVFDTHSVARGLFGHGSSDCPNDDAPKNGRHISRSPTDIRHRQSTGRAANSTAKARVLPSNIDLPSGNHGSKLNDRRPPNLLKTVSILSLRRTARKTAQQACAHRRLDQKRSHHSLQIRKREYYSYQNNYR